MEMISHTLSLLLIIGIPIYIFSIDQFYKLINEIKPKWLIQKGSLSFFYQGMPPICNPNISLAVVVLAFNGKWKSINNDEVQKYANRVRVLLPTLLILLLSLVSGSILNAN